MRCPFLKEAEVKFCGSSALGKMIVKTPKASADEKCSTSHYVDCNVYKTLNLGHDTPRCPAMQEMPVQYCAAAPVQKFIPYSESIVSRCGNDNHRYCELYIAMAHPEKQTTPAAHAAPIHNGESSMQPALLDHSIDEIQGPGGLFYSNNHMWLDVTEEGSCHVGIDGFLAKLLGQVDQVRFVTCKGLNHPTAVLKVRGVDIHMVFPNPMLLTGSNLYLRAHPEKLADPYGAGWLFEGVTPPPSAGKSSASVCAGLMDGDQAQDWMAGEVGRISTFVHEKLARSHPDFEDLVMDGGVFSDDLIRHLNHDELIDLLNEFFLPHASWIR